VQLAWDEDEDNLIIVMMIIQRVFARDLCQADLPSVSQDCFPNKMEVSAGYKHDLNQLDSQRFQRLLSFLAEQHLG